MREGSFENEVKCPEGTNPNDWISMHAVEFYNQLTLFFTMLQGNCTSESCPHMCAGPNYKFLWQDEKDYKKPTDMPAKEYISLLFDWADAKLGDIKFFPHDPKAKYPSNFKSEINKIGNYYYKRTYCDDRKHKCLKFKHLAVRRRTPQDDGQQFFYKHCADSAQ